MQAVLQHREATLVAWIQATGTRGHHLACASKRSSTVICPGNSPKAEHELRLKPDHPMGAGQPHHFLQNRHHVATMRAKRWKLVETRNNVFRPKSSYFNYIRSLVKSFETSLISFAMMGSRVRVTQAAPVKSSTHLFFIFALLS